MKVTFENVFDMTEEHINLPFMIEEAPIGIISAVDESNITVEIWNRFIGVEMQGEVFKNNLEISAFYLSKEKQESFETIKKIFKDEKEYEEFEKNSFQL